MDLEDLINSPPRNQAQSDLSPADATELCDVAEKTWDRASIRAKQVTFTWRGQRFRSTMTDFRMLVDTIDGEPVASRHH